MRIEDDKIISSYDALIQAGHPDPEGFLARAEIKTGFDYDGEYKGAVGTFGVDKKQAMLHGYTEDELLLTDTNLAAAITVDINNLRKSNGDIDEMYRKSNPGSKTGTDRFIAKLGRERESLTNKFVFDEGRLISFRQSDKEGDTTDTFSAKATDDKVVYSETRKVKTADDIKKQTNTFEFRRADRDRIDEMMKNLATYIVDEKPIDAL